MVPDLYQLFVNYSTDHVFLADIVTEIQFYKHPKDQASTRPASNVTAKKNPRAHLEISF